MTDQHPLPPERQLSDQARAHHRAELMRHAAGEDRRPRRWLVPAAAAAVVAAVSIGGALLLDDGDERVGEPAGGPGGSVSASPAPDEPTAAPVEPRPEGPEQAGVVPERATSMSPVPGGSEPAEECGSLRLPIAGAEEVGAVDIGDTTVRVYSDGQRWVTCDEWAALDGGPATLFAVHPVGAALDRATLGISMNFSMSQDGVGEYVAGGLLPDGVESIAYAFPDGHVEEAVLDGDTWAMAYFATTPELNGTRAITGDVTVTVTRQGGATEEVTLRAPLDFCSQTNHGC